MNINYIPDKNDDLLKELTEPTERKAEQNDADFFNTEQPGQENFPNVKVHVNRDFVPEPEPDQITDDQQEPGPAPPIIDYKEQAKLIIAFVDGFQSLTLPIAYQKAYFSSDEIEKLKDLKKRMEGEGQAILSGADQELYSKYTEVQQLNRDLPFTEKEINYLQPPLSAVLEKYKFTPSAETLLMGAIFTVMAPRLAPLLITFNK